MKWEILIYMMGLNSKKCNCEERIKSLEDTITKVVSSLEKTNDKFYTMVAKIQVEHMKQLNSQSDKHARLFERTTDKFIKHLETKKQEREVEKFEKISTLDKGEPNSIEKEEHIDDPLVDFSNVPIQDIANVQFDGEEEVLPIHIS